MVKKIWWIILILLLFGCSQQPWLSEPQGGWKHVSSQYNNFFSDEIECRYLDAADFTQKSPVVPLRSGRDSFTTYDECMERKGYTNE
jgi:hypothetical protein